MSEIDDVLLQIEDKALKIVEDNRNLREEVVRLKEVQLKLQEALKDNDILINNLTEQNKILKLGNALTQKGDNTEIKLKINQLIKDIDNSLALLTKID